jgi:hypothetical protein
MSQHENYIQYSLLLDPDLSQINPVYTFLRHFLKLLLNIILFSKTNYLFLDFPTKV